jgi:ribonuclease J
MIKLTPIGGIGEIGMNMFAFEYGGHVMFIDCGVLFPPFQYLGVEAIVTDYETLLDKYKKIDAIFITHGHEDHIGGLPYLFQQDKPKVYATPYAAEVIKLRVNNVLGSKFKTDVTEVKYETPIKEGPFNIEYIQVDHSIPDASALFITIKGLRILYVTDFRFSGKNKSAFLSKIQEIKRKGEIDLLLSDSTNADNVDESISEQAVLENLDKYFSKAKGRIVTTLFSSNISRVNQLIVLCKKHGKSLFVAGTNLKAHIAIAKRLGYLENDKGCIKPDSELAHTAKSKTVFLCTGSQAERNSSIMKLSNGIHPQLKIENGDLIIFSSSRIPGNEKLIMEAINKLAERGAQIIYSDDVHCSGHANIDELRALIQEVKPRYFLPIHGEYLHLKSHVDIAVSEGVPRENCFIPKNGDHLTYEGKTFSYATTVEKPGRLYVDSMTRELIDSSILKERAICAERGLFSVVLVPSSKNSGKLFVRPRIFTKGVSQSLSMKGLISGIEKKIGEFIRQNNKHRKLNDMKDDIKQLVKREVRRRYDDKPDVAVLIVDSD